MTFIYIVSLKFRKNEHYTDVLYEYIHWINILQDKKNFSINEITSNDYKSSILWSIYLKYVFITIYILKEI